jgi:hypothetical protein
MKHIYIATLLAPTLAIADCPTGDDLETGIKFQIEGGATETFQRLENGTTQANYRDGESEETRVLLAKGVYLLEYTPVIDGVASYGERTGYSYDMTPDEMPNPKPGITWNTKASLIESGLFTSEIQSYEFGQLTELTLGSCTYDMMTIDISLDNDGEITLETLHYLPELAIAYLAETTFNGETDTYVYFDIEALN